MKPPRHAGSLRTPELVCDTKQGRPACHGGAHNDVVAPTRQQENIVLRHCSPQLLLNLRVSWKAYRAPDSECSPHLQPHLERGSLASSVGACDDHGPHVRPQLHVYGHRGRLRVRPGLPGTACASSGGVLLAVAQVTGLGACLLALALLALLVTGVEVAGQQQGVPAGRQLR